MKEVSKISINGHVYTAEELTQIVIEHEAREREDEEIGCETYAQAVEGILADAWVLFFDMYRNTQGTYADGMMESVFENLEKMRKAMGVGNEHA